jgi:hypothetical protein
MILFVTTAVETSNPTLTSFSVVNDLERDDASCIAVL